MSKLMASLSLLVVVFSSVAVAQNPLNDTAGPSVAWPLEVIEEVLTPCVTVPQVFQTWNVTVLPSLAKAAGLYNQLIAENQTLLVPLNSAYWAYFSVANTKPHLTRAQLTDNSSATSVKKLNGLVRYGILPGLFPTAQLHNLQRLYGLLKGVNVAVKVPPVGVEKNIRILGIYGDTSAEIVRKDIPVCGGGIVHLLNSVVLPYPV